MKLDSNDLKIIEELKKDARQSIREIAKVTKIRPSTVHQRIQRLRASGAIERFTVKLDNKSVGENFIVFMFVSTSENLPDSFFKSNNIKEVFGITGEYDLLLKLKFGDIYEFNEFVINLRRQKNIKKTLTTIVTVNLKEEI